MLKLTWSNDDCGRFVVHRDGSVVGRQTQPLPVHHVHLDTGPQ